ncbi:hypothetical protein BJ742DRAFT_849975 [Cladochytrium replicatum]|nr:hypothetical protein BJ742DRAFT_849975 [Cladochytrium replicatum]
MFDVVEFVNRFERPKRLLGFDRVERTTLHEKLENVTEFVHRLRAGFDTERKELRAGFEAEQKDLKDEMHDQAAKERHRDSELRESTNKMERCLNAKRMDAKREQADKTTVEDAEKIRRLQDLLEKERLEKAHFQVGARERPKAERAERYLVECTRRTEMIQLEFLEHAKRVLSLIGGTSREAAKIDNELCGVVAAGSQKEMNDSMEVESIKEIDTQREDRRVVNVDSCSQTEHSGNNERIQTEMMTYEDVGDAKVDNDSQTEQSTGDEGMAADKFDISSQTEPCCIVDAASQTEQSTTAAKLDIFSQTELCCNVDASSQAEMDLSEDIVAIKADSCSQAVKFCNIEEAILKASLDAALRSEFMLKESLNAALSRKAMLIGVQNAQRLKANEVERQIAVWEDERELFIEQRKVIADSERVRFKSTIEALELEEARREMWQCKERGCGLLFMMESERDESEQKLALRVQKIAVLEQELSAAQQQVEQARSQCTMFEHEKQEVTRRSQKKAINKGKNSHQSTPWFTMTEYRQIVEGDGPEDNFQ